MGGLAPEGRAAVTGWRWPIGLTKGRSRKGGGHGTRGGSAPVNRGGRRDAGPRHDRPMNRPGPAMQAQVRDILILTASTGGGHDSVAVALQEALGALAPEVGVRVLDPLSGRIRNGPLSAGRWYDATVAHAPWLWGLFYHATNNAWAVRLGLAAGALLWARRLRSALQTARPGLVVA